MRSSKKRYTTIGMIALALVLSATACTSSDPTAETAAPNTSATVSKSPTATPRPSQTPTATPSTTPPAPAPAPAPLTTEAPPAPTPAPAPPAAVAPVPAPAPTQNPFINPQPATESFVITAEEAIAIIAEYHDNNPDLQYRATENGDGSYDVHVTSLSIVAQGGDGDAGTYVVGQDRAYFLK